MKILIVTITLLFSSLIMAESFNVKDRIDAESFYKSVYDSLFGKPEYSRVDSFLNHLEKLDPKVKADAMKMVNELDKLLPKKILLPLIYWSVVEDRPERRMDVLMLHLVNRVLILRDELDHPLNSSSEKEVARYIFGQMGLSIENTGNLFSELLPKIEGKAKYVAGLTGDALRNELKSELFSLEFKKISPSIDDYLLSYPGFIPGNIVEVVSENDRSPARIEWLNNHVIFAGGKLSWDAPYMKMPTDKTEGHPIFTHDPIYKKIREMIDRSTDSIFIDIFLFGGTLGGTLSRYLIDQTLLKSKKNPNFKTILLHDYATNYNMLDEMMPIFEYIKGRIDNEPEVKKRVFLLQANIQRHPPGVPFGLTNLLPKTPAVFKEIEKKSTYYESKIDHSKVIVIDANTDHPEAYFGSKNWTDHSGGYYYDDAIWVKGPAAAVVQASYYDDIDAALTENQKELGWFFYKEKGLDNKSYLPRKKEILDFMKIKKTNYPHLGSETVRLAEANVDGKIKNVRNILIDMITRAKKNIYMEQLFIYDKYVNDALIKQKIQYPELDIKILADHNGNFGMNGLPNTIFMKELVDNGIEVRARKTLGIEAEFPDGTKKEYHQENHRKITSVDGKILLGGSSNLNPDTLQGSFREFGAQIFDKNEIAEYETDFMKAWNDSEQTMDLEVDTLKLIVLGKELSQEVSALVNDLAGTLIRSKDDLEERH